MVLFRNEIFVLKKTFSKEDAPENTETGAGSRACRGRMCQCPWEATLIDIAETQAETQGGDPKTQHEVEHVWFSTEVDDSLRNLTRANDTGFCRVLLKENGSALRYAHKLPDCYNPCVRAPGGTFWCRLRIPPAALFLFFSGSASNRYNNFDKYKRWHRTHANEHCMATWKIMHNLNHTGDCAVWL